MGMYNLLFGKNPMSDVLLATLDLDREKVGRFRDAWVEPDRIAVYTRNGGGNRDHWDFSTEKESGPDCDCPGCIIEYRLPQHPLYLFDQDDEFDCTYATVYFRFPEQYKTELAAIALNEPVDTSERWHRMIEALKG